jgi:hypothetical protein
VSRAGRNLVRTYRKQGTFRAQAAERSGRAAQNTPLPPRCRDCRLPGTISVIIDGITEFFCGDHVPAFIEGADGRNYFDMVKESRNRVADELGD